MATYVNGQWEGLNVDTNFRHSGNNPYTANDYATIFPYLTEDDYAGTYPYRDQSFYITEFADKTANDFYGIIPDRTADFYASQFPFVESSAYAERYPHTTINAESIVNAYPKKIADDFTTGEYALKVADDYANDYPYAVADDYLTTYPDLTADNFFKDYPNRTAADYEGTEDKYTYRDANYYAATYPHRTADSYADDYPQNATAAWYVDDYPFKHYNDFANDYPYKTPDDYANIHPYVKASDFYSTYPDKLGSDYKGDWPVADHVGNFIKGHPNFKKWTNGYVPLAPGKDSNNRVKQFTLKTANDYAAQYPTNLKTQGTIYVGYVKKDKKFNGKIGTTKQSVGAGDGRTKAFKMTITHAPKGLTKTLNAFAAANGLDPNTKPLLAVQGVRDTYAANYQTNIDNAAKRTKAADKANKAILKDAETYMGQWNDSGNTTRDIWAKNHNKTAKENRKAARDTHNTQAAEDRQEDANDYNSDMLGLRKRDAKTHNDSMKTKRQNAADDYNGNQLTLRENAAIVYNQGQDGNRERDANTHNNDVVTPAINKAVNDWNGAQDTNRKDAAAWHNKNVAGPNRNNAAVDQNELAYRNRETKAYNQNQIILGNREQAAIAWNKQADEDRAAAVKLFNDGQDTLRDRDRDTYNGAQQTSRDNAATAYNRDEAAPGRDNAADTYNGQMLAARTKLADEYNEGQLKARQDSVNTFNEGADEKRKNAAIEANEIADDAYDMATSFNKWSDDTIKWAKNTQTGYYKENRQQIFDTVTSKLDEFVKKGWMTQDQANQTRQNLKNNYGTYYIKERIPGIWNPDVDGGLRDPLGMFKSDYYLKEYGDTTGLNKSWQDATKLGNADSPYDPDNDLDITARYGTLDNYAHYHYSTQGKASGFRGQEADVPEEAEAYRNTVTDEEMNIIRDKMLGLTGTDEYGRVVEWGEDILDPNSDETASLLETTVGSIFGEKDLEQQDKFSTLAQDILLKSVNQLNEEESKTKNVNLFKSLPGFSEIYGANKELANSILGDSGIGGYLNLMGKNTKQMQESLEGEFEKITGITNHVAEYNWQKWLDETIEEYKNMETIEGERVDSEGNPVEYDLTTDENKLFMQNFINDYISPRFNKSKSMSEFISYLDVQDENKQNIFQTQTAMNALKQLAEVRAKAYFTELSKSTGSTAAFDYKFYMDPTTRLDSLQGMNKEYVAPASVVQRYENQKGIVQGDWAKAKQNPNTKADGTYSWGQLAYMYGLDINDEEQFAKLHFQVKGLKNAFEGAADVVDGNTVNDWLTNTLLPLVEEEKISLKDAAFMQFVTPKEFAMAMLEGIDPIENKEEWQKVLEKIGLDDVESSLEEVQKYIEEAFETGEALVIREGIKHLNETKQKVNQKNLGVDYIQRDPVAILGNPGDIEVGSQEWRELLDKYDIDEDFDYDQARNALLNIENIDKPTTNVLFSIYRNQGYGGTEEEFMQEFFPDATKEDLVDLDFLGKAMQGDLNFKKFDPEIGGNDPFATMLQFEDFLGSTEDPYFLKDEDDGDEIKNEASYFDFFPEEDRNTDSKGFGIMDTWTGGLFK